MTLRTFFLGASFFVFAGFAGCSLANSFEDKLPEEEETDTGTVKRDSSTPKEDSAVEEDTSTPDTSVVDAPAGIDPQCINPATQTAIVKGLPNTGAFDGLHLCCGGKYIEISSESNCGGCGVNCKLSPGGAVQNLTCTKVIRTDDAAKAYYVCEGCKAVGDYGTNASCYSNYCSMTGSGGAVSLEGRCVASMAVGCNETYCQSVGGKCAAGAGVPNRYCEF